MSIPWIRGARRALPVAAAGPREEAEAHEADLARVRTCDGSHNSFYGLDDLQAHFNAIQAARQIFVFRVAFNLHYYNINALDYSTCARPAHRLSFKFGQSSIRPA